MVPMPVIEQKPVQGTECDDWAAGQGQFKFYIFTLKGGTVTNTELNSWQCKIKARPHIPLKVTLKTSLA